MRPLLCSAAIALLLSAGGAFAQVRQDITDRYIDTQCQTTPMIGTGNYPGFVNVMTNNRLALPPGKVLVAEGQPVYFYARVLDANCVPVSEAKVELWHADPQGRYRYATKAMLATPDATFAGSGRTNTTNLGEFMFFTVYPGPYQYYITVNKQKILVKRAPHFNIRISHEDMGTFDTNLYFQGDRHNPEDDKLKKMSADKQAKVMMRVMPRDGDWNHGVQAVIDIVLPKASPWRRF